jgi:deazaflavin-dependent oxidoreductase (nitroreductase family)
MRGEAARYLRPTGVERAFGRVLAALVRVGVVRGHFWVLEVRGRKSGRTISVPVDVLNSAGRRFLVSPRGETNWARNVRSAGEVALVRAGRQERYAAREIAAAERPAILKAYVDRFAAEVQRFFPVAKGSPEAAFAELAPRYPVFELLRLGT